MHSERRKQLALRGKAQQERLRCGLIPAVKGGQSAQRNPPDT